MKIKFSNTIIIIVINSKYKVQQRAENSSKSTFNRAQDGKSDVAFNFDTRDTVLGKKSHIYLCVQTLRLKKVTDLKCVLCMQRLPSYFCNY